MWLCFLLSVRTTSIMCAITDALAFQVSVHWRRAFLEAIWMGELLCDQTRYYKYSRFSSDTYDIYYANPGLIPSVQTEPADYPLSPPWTLEECRDDATVEDICDFIVEYINSDVMVGPTP